jgi:glycosyltransferase involved in cell wall biosynthesis
VEGLDLSEALACQGIRMHGTLLPGGGFFAAEEGYQLASSVIERLHTTFSFVEDILNRFPSAVRVPAAYTETRFHAATSDRWATPEPLICLFAADNPVRKGLDVALSTVARLMERFHLHVVGPHEHRRPELPAAVATFHGWLDPFTLRDLHRRVHVFLSPVSAEPAGVGEGVTDGFPTQAAADAMSSGCLLVSANPLGDYRVFEPGVHYIECPPDPTMLADVLRRLAHEPKMMRRVAKAGSARVRERMDVRLGVSAKLEMMGL